MPRPPPFVAKPHFQQPQHFTFIEDLKVWYCNICTSPDESRRRSLSSKAALRHEKGGEHVKAVEDHLKSWEEPQPELQAWLQVPDYDELFERRAEEQMSHVDSLKDLIPFWLRQVEAAERGEELRLEAFLDALHYAEKGKGDWTSGWNVQATSWAVKGGQDNTNPWDTAAHGWAVDPAEADQSCDTANERRSDLGSTEERNYKPLKGPTFDRDAERDSFSFVEKVARLKSISADRKQNLHDFYKYPTDVKVTKIQELILKLKDMQ